VPARCSGCPGEPGLDRHGRRGPARLGRRSRGPHGGAGAPGRGRAGYVTLQFLGGKSEERLAEAEAALGDAAAQSAPTAVTLHGIGAFPGLERPRIVGRPAPGCARDARAAGAGGRRAGRAGIPLRRAPVASAPDHRPRLRREALASRGFGRLLIQELALMRSDPSLAGARYTVHCAVTLAGIAAVGEGSA